MNKDLVLYIIAMALSTIFVFFLIDYCRDGMIWKLTVIAEDVEDTWCNFVTYGINPLYFMLLWIGCGSMLAFIFHLVFDNGEHP